MTPTAVIQSKQGIGDVIWHLPFVRAIAAVSPGHQVTFLTLPSSHAAETLEVEPCVAQVIYYENRGSEFARGLHLARFVKVLRGGRFKTVWILDRSVRPALGAWLAGVPNRIGLGFGGQRPFITNPGVGQEHRHDMPVQYLTALMAAMQVQLPTTEPNLPLPPRVTAHIRARYGMQKRPWTVLALGGSHPAKDWPDSYWAKFLGLLRSRSPGTVFLIGGADQSVRAAALIAQTAGAIDACDLSIVEAAALLGESDLFVGPDSGPLNLAAAVGTPAFGLFGATPVLTYSRFIHPLLPAHGPQSVVDGMKRILPAQVMEQIAPYLGTPLTGAQ